MGINSCATSLEIVGRFKRYRKACPQQIATHLEVLQERFNCQTARCFHWEFAPPYISGPDFTSCKRISIFTKFWYQNHFSMCSFASQWNRPGRIAQKSIIFGTRIPNWVRGVILMWQLLYTTWFLVSKDQAAEIILLSYILVSFYSANCKH